MCDQPEKDDAVKAELKKSQPTSTLLTVSQPPESNIGACVPGCNLQEEWSAWILESGDSLMAQSGQCADQEYTSVCSTMDINVSMP